MQAISWCNIYSIFNFLSNLETLNKKEENYKNFNTLITKIVF